MKRPPYVLLCAALLAGCESPEAERTRGGGPGADSGNRAGVVLMHEGAKPFHGTPHLIPLEGAPVAGAHHADALSRK